MARLPSNPEPPDGNPDLAEREQGAEAEAPAVVTETEAPSRTNSWIWLAAGMILIVGAAILLFTGDLEFDLPGALGAVILASAGFLCLFVAGGFVRRPRGRGREGTPPPPA